MKKLNECEEMTNIMDKYVKNRIDEAKIGDAIASKGADLELLIKYSKYSVSSAVYAAMVLGFANGAEWERNK